MIFDLIGLVLTGICRYKETPRIDIRQHGYSYVCLFGNVHEVFMDGTTTQLAPSCMPYHK